MSYQNLVALLVEAIKEQQDQIEALKEQVTEIELLKAQNEMLFETLARLEKIVKEKEK